MKSEGTPFKRREPGALPGQPTIFKNMNSKQKGNIANSAVIAYLNKLEYNVFHELGDLSKIDLIAEKNNKLIKIQVKYVPLKEEVINLPLRKTGPNGYRYIYSYEDVDYFAIYCPDINKILFVKSSLACEKKASFAIRVSKPKNNNKEYRFIDDFLKL